MIASRTAPSVNHPPFVSSPKLQPSASESLFLSLTHADGDKSVGSASQPYPHSLLESSLGWGGEIAALALSLAVGEVTARPAVTPYHFCGPLPRSGLNCSLSFIIQNLEFKISQPAPGGHEREESEGRRSKMNGRQREGASAHHILCTLCILWLKSFLFIRVHSCHSWFKYLTDRKDERT